MTEEHVLGQLVYDEPRSDAQHLSPHEALLLPRLKKKDQAETRRYQFIPGGRFALNKEALDRLAAHEYVSKTHFSLMIEVVDHEEETPALAKIYNLPELGPGYLEAFYREYDLLLALNHPTIAKTKGLTLVPVPGESATMLYPAILLEKRSGKSTKQILKERTMQPNEVIALSRQIASALDYCNNRQIAHNDVHPGNILFDENTGKATLIDFGNSSRIDQRRVANLSGLNFSFAPPQLRQMIVTPESDQYMLAATITYLLSGKQAQFINSKGQLVAIKYQEEQDTLAPIPTLNPALQAVIQRALAFDPYKRFFNCQHLVLELEQALRKQA